MDEERGSDCPICLQKLLYPVKLPCNHTFCFLCIKGIRKNSDAIKTCAMCRKPFNIEEIEQNVEIEKSSIEEFNWFYQSKNMTSFWAFDERTSKELDKAFSENKDHIVVSIAGFPYYIDLVRMVQYPVSHPERLRKIKRCNEVNDENFKIKGIAGVRLAEESGSSDDRNKSPENRDNVDTNSVALSPDEQLSQILSEALQIDEELNKTD